LIYDYAYNVNNDIIFITESECNYNSNYWVILEKKNEYSYDSNNNKLLELKYTKDTINDNWILDEQFEYAYDENGNLILSLNSVVWDSVTNNWENEYKKEYLYDVNNNLILETWSSTTDFLFYNKIEYSYDINNNLIVKIDYSQNIKVEFTYDKENNKTSEKYYVWNENLFLWEIKLKYFYFYNLNISASEKNNLHRINFNLFPNPTTNELNLQVKDNQNYKIEVLNEIGQTIYNSNIINTSKIDFSNFSKGIYFVKLSNQNGVEVRKIVKE